MLAVLPAAAGAQGRTLTLEECRQMAVENNRSLQQAAVKVEMAGYDRQAALANYFPKVSATGAWIYNNSDISLVSDDVSSMLTGSGTLVQSQVQQKMTELTQAIMSNPYAAQEYMGSAMWQTVLGALSQTDVSQAINSIGSQLDEALHPDLSHITVGVISVQQPVFYGGKIIAANQIAALAEELARTKYDTEYQQIIVDVDQAYWQIVSIAAKKQLAENYADLLHTMEHDVELAIAEGVSTQSDALAIKVKANEADMLYTKSVNGLKLAKMLLCKQIGLDLNTEITLADEGGESIPEPVVSEPKTFEEIYAMRPELHSLDLAQQIYDKKVSVARADMMPTVALTANYLVCNPNLSNGFSNSFSGTFGAGVLVNIPIFHGFEALSKTRKAKAEASLYRIQYEDACNMVNLQVNQLHNQLDEARERLSMAESNLRNAEENLRIATVGFEEGVVASDVALQAQTAWLQAHSEYIEAGIELQMTNANLQKAEGYETKYNK